MPRAKRKTPVRKSQPKRPPVAPAKARKTSLVASPRARAKKHVPVKKRAVCPKYFAYRMKDGTDEFIAGLQKSDDFSEEYGTMVARKFEFTTKTAFEQHKKTIKIVTPTKGDSIDEDTHGKVRSSGADEPMTSEEQTLVAAAVQMITDSAPCDRIEINHKTNGTATTCILVLRFLNSWGNDQWFMKPEHLCVTLRGYVAKFKQENKLVTEALQNLDYGKRRDTKKGPEAAEVQAWESRDGARTNSYPLHVAHTYFTIPYEDLASEAEEREIIENVATSLGETMRDIFQSPTFLPCFKAAVKHDGMWAAMMGTSYDPGSPDDQRKKKKALTFMQYVKHCKIRVKACQNLNTHLVLRDTQGLVSHLFNSRVKGGKYITHAADDEDSDAESDDPGSDVVGSDGEATADQDDAPRTPTQAGAHTDDEDERHDTDDEEVELQRARRVFAEGEAGSGDKHNVVPGGDGGSTTNNEDSPRDDDSHAVREIYTDYPESVDDPGQTSIPKTRGRGRPRNATTDK